MDFSPPLGRSAAGRAGTPHRSAVSRITCDRGVAVALLPNGPRFSLDPDLALALFVAPVLLDGEELRPRQKPANVKWIAATIPLSLVPFRG
jgi:hypothetical protein